MRQRIEYLDGLRGVAIALVVLFHAYARWPEHVPYGDRYASVWGYGFLGVELFFLTSGFVILMTLEKCTGFKDFMVRRWKRLFPAMLVCSVVVFATAGWFSERPAGQPTWASLVPGLLFVEPLWIKWATGYTIVPLEGAFWSLYVEFKFYLIAGAVFFVWGERRLLGVLLALALLGHAVAAWGQQATPACPTCCTNCQKPHPCGIWAGSRPGLWPTGMSKPSAGFGGGPPVAWPRCVPCCWGGDHWT